MYSPEQTRMMMELFNNPLFKQGAFEFFGKWQQEGQQAASKFWGASPYGAAFPDTQQMVERMADFYAAMGFVTVARHDAVVKENEQLKAENQGLRDALQGLQQSFLAEGGAKAQQAWQSLVDKQLEMGREASKNFFDVLKQYKPQQ